MKKIKETLSFLKKQSTVAKYAITEIRVLCYAYYYFNREYEPVFRTKSVLYPDKEVRIERYKETHKGESTEEYEAWHFVFYVECFGQNLYELKLYLEDRFKGFVDRVSVEVGYVFDKTGKLSIEFKKDIKKFKYF